MGKRSRELIATDEPAIRAELVFDNIVVKDRESDRSLSNAACTDKGDRFEIFCETNDLLNKLAPSITRPGRWRRRFPWGDTTRM